MVFSDGTPKGMRQVLNKRGVDTKGMKAADMRKALGEMHDFKYEMMKVEHLVSNCGYRAIFIPKFHCELNLIEACWGQAKRYTRAHCDYSFHGLERTVNPGLNSITLDHIRKFYRKVTVTMRAYREGVSAGPDLEKALK